MKKIWKKIFVIVCVGIVATIIMGVTAWNAYRGNYIKEVKHLAFTTDFNFNCVVTFYSKGSFIAGEKIYARIKIYFLNDSFYHKYEGDIISITFQGASDYTNYTHPSSFLYGIPSDAGSHSLITNKTIETSCEMAYWLPGTYPFSVAFYNVSSGEIKNVDYFHQQPNAIVIAPLETKIQIESNNLMLSLTWVLLLATVWGIIMSIVTIITRQDKKIGIK